MTNQDPTTIDELLAYDIPNAEEVYDKLMAEIEPDLMTDAMPHLAEKYEGETEEERTERFARYEKAFEKYEEVFDAWIGGLKQKYEVARRDLMKKAEKKTIKKEAAMLQELEASLDAL